MFIYRVIEFIAKEGVNLEVLVFLLVFDAENPFSDHKKCIINYKYNIISIKLYLIIFYIIISFISSVFTKQKLLSTHIQFKFVY